MEAHPNSEAEDARKVDEALKAIQAHDPQKAEVLLTEVIRNAPAEYVYQRDEFGCLFIKFWDKREFLHYTSCRPGTATKPVVWQFSAYPRAFYYLGFLMVQAKQYEPAIEFLDRGLSLEPTNPKFKLEKAQALSRLGRYREALRLYEEIAEISPHISGHEICVALRGRASVLIELHELDRAEEALQESLEMEPGNPVALNELGYIAHLRHGGQGV